MDNNISILIDPCLEERWLKNKYGEDIDVELARMHERAQSETEWQR